MRSHLSASMWAIVLVTYANIVSHLTSLRCNEELKSNRLLKPAQSQSRAEVSGASTGEAITEERVRMLKIYETARNVQRSEQRMRIS
ncbi:uncharacterized protein EV420DRAFT_1583490 [Desarmillaria tabescens]|uniref:Secreted protein n=1 Tax=Armillaria tabescens TaxID=1929756 RepID=A0AA39MLQ9_ARMTA|nr:uncharacterized protein EV420DRAFT_1583490 [Desarmillaria tabescens]KAK0439486.1 hypothetical protein EV420DRAFT_1583490 [Desarmillaria tabescens]